MYFRIKLNSTTVVKVIMVCESLFWWSVVYKPPTCLSSISFHSFPLLVPFSINLKGYSTVALAFSSYFFSCFMLFIIYLLHYQRVAVGGGECTCELVFVRFKRFGCTSDKHAHTQKHKHTHTGVADCSVEKIATNVALFENWKLPKNAVEISTRECGWP